MIPISHTTSARLVALTVTAILLFAAIGYLRLHATLKTKDAEFYAQKLGDPSFRWYGVTTNEISIPSDHAARALAFIGDESVPYLLQAIGNPRIDRTSIYQALDQIGLPVEEFRDDVFNKYDPTRLKAWFDAHRLSSKEARSAWRVQRGLPPL